MSIKNVLIPDPDFNLEDCLKRINTIEPIDKILSKNLDPAALPKYYAKVGRLFKLFHSKEGSMHLPIATGENEKHDYKLLYHARYIAALIKNIITKPLLNWVAALLLTLFISHSNCPMFNLQLLILPQPI